VLNLIAALIAGMALGYVLRKKKRINITRVTFGVILFLIFSLGFSLGSNNELLTSLPKVGLNAVVILMSAVGFSVLFVKAAGKMVKLD
jgi:uncharacterized membrane protein YbjE (DUF340 family)